MGALPVLHLHNMEKVKAKIQELVPEVMELKFGCEVLDDVGIVDIVLWKDTHDWKGYDVVKLVGCAVPLKVADLKGILGSPITLAVVLRAIPNIGINSKGQFFEIYQTKLMPVWSGVFWNLEHDNYDEQSQDTKDFIGELLGITS